MTTLHAQMTFYAGDTLTFDVLCKDANGAVVNLNGIDIEWLLNDPYGDNVETYSIVGGVTTGGIAVLDAPNGRIGIDVTPDRTTNYRSGYYSDQLRLTVPEPGFDDIVVSEMVGHIRIKTPLKSATVNLQALSLVTSPPE